MIVISLIGIKKGNNEMILYYEIKITELRIEIPFNVMLIKEIRTTNKYVTICPRITCHSLIKKDSLTNKGFKLTLIVINFEQSKFDY